MKLARLTLPLVFIFLFNLSTAFSQHAPHLEGEILVQLASGLQPNGLVRSLNYLDGRPTQLRVDRKISAPMNIYALTFDAELINENAMLQAVWRDPRVSNAQFNHFVKLRSTIPDDPQFDDQWQYINTGQSGGTPGADIDMDLAWDITTGGLTPQGDTIVVCIIDGGYQITHEDLAENVWYNYAEIPNNGIDDDNNGFIDDFRGWNTGSGDDEITFNTGHGTPVAGIVGAKGNNGIGVAGVNWDIKLMLVSGGSGLESEVLEAYSYPLVARMRYNETNGAEGAFVVATNASWGVDGGQPADAPLWCAFYDTLGVHGVLNAGATINGNENIDTFGDLPTGCPSDYLISVTNMNHNDVKVTQAGYGTTHVDLGAFGQGTWNIRPTDSYGGFGGTSGATPHVTGTIALIYSAPCNDLTALAKTDPGAAALKVKRYILDGVDPNASLDTITLTGGRLNVFNSLLLALNDCGPCPTPISPEATSITDTSALVSWQQSDNALTDMLRWRVLGTDDWMTADSITPPYSLSNLLACTSYEFQVMSSCADTVSGYSDSFVFLTEGCCDIPENIMVAEISDTSAIASWQSVLAAESYDLRLRPVDTTNWLTFNVPDTNFSLSGLMPCTNYELQVRTACQDSLSPFSASTLWLSKGCGACIDLIYCTVGPLNASEEWIDSVSLHTLNNASGNNDSYGDFTGQMVTDLLTNTSYDITLVPGYAGTLYTERFRVWIDYNQNGDFSDPDETVYISGSTTTAVMGSFTVPDDALPGLTRMRVSMYYQETPEACTPPSEAYGEIEDYCVNISSGVASGCDIPENLQNDLINSTTQSLSWDSVGNATSYDLQYKLVSDSIWTLVDSVASPYLLGGLLPCAEYEFQVSTQCDTLNTSFSDSHFFQSTGCCDAPDSLTINMLTETSAVANWNASAEAESYDFRIREAATTAWVATNTSATSLALTDLMPCTNYEIQVRATCPDSISLYSEIVSFATLGCGTCQDLPYCPPVALNGGEEWIDSLMVHTLNNISGSDGGYGDFTDSDLTTTLATNNSYDIMLAPGYAETVYAEYFRIWIDFNQDGMFDNDTESVYVFDSTTVAVTGNISIPDNALLGETRMRVAMYYNETPEACNSPAEAFGEIEDYCVTIIEGIASCNVPTGLDTMMVTQTQATVSWDAVNLSIDYSLRYKKTADANWIVTTTTTPDILLTGLDFCEEYEVQVKANCDGSESDYSESFVFTTSCVSSQIELPTGIASLHILPNPFKEQLIVDFRLANAQDQVQLDLINQFGQSLQTLTARSLSTDTERVIFDGRELPAGVYIVRLKTTDGMQVSRKVVKL